MPGTHNKLELAGFKFSLTNRLIKISLQSPDVWYIIQHTIMSYNARRDHILMQRWWHHTEYLSRTAPYIPGCLMFIKAAQRLICTNPSAALQHRKLHNATETQHIKSSDPSANIVSSPVFAQVWSSHIVPAPDHTMMCNVEHRACIHVDPSRLIVDFMLHRHRSKMSIRAFILKVKP